MNIRVLVAIFSAVVGAISLGLVPFAYFGDRNPKWVMRLLWIALIASVAFLAAWLV